MLVHTVSIAALLILMDTSVYKITKIDKIKPYQLIKLILSKDKVNTMSFTLLILSIIGYPVAFGFTSKWFFALNINSYNSIILIISTALSSGAAMLYGWKVIDQTVSFRAMHPQYKKVSIKDGRAVSVVSFIMALSMIGSSLYITRINTSMTSSDHHFIITK